MPLRAVRLSPWLWLAVTAAALAADAGLDAGKSSIIAIFKQEAVPVDAPFTRFSGSIVYSAANPAGATAAIDVETASLDIGDEAYNAEVRKPGWFDSAKYPRASFRATSIKAVSAGRIDATGTLTVKGRVLTVTVPITVKTAGGFNSFDGELTISRKAFGIGDPVWEDVVDDKVNVRFHLVSAAR